MQVVRTTATSVPRKRQGTARKPKQRRQSPDIMPMYRHIAKTNIIERWVSQQGVLGTSAGGNILITTIHTGQVTSALDWTSISGEFQQYRVKRHIARFVPIMFEVAPNPALCLFVSRYWGLAPNNLTNMASEPSFFGRSTNEEIEIENNWLGFPDAHLYTNVGTAIPTEQTYGFAMISNTIPSARASVNYFVTYNRYLVEFSGTY